MQIEQLEFIVSVSRTLSFSKTAEKLFVSQSAISQSIRRLEVEIGFEIFNRTRYGVTLTKKGKELISYAEVVLIKYQELKGKVTELSELNQKELKIGLVSGLHLPFLPSIISQLKIQFPHSHITIIENSSVHVTESIINKEVDIGVIAVYENTLKKKDKLYFEHLTDINMYVSAQKDSPLTTHEFVTDQQILNQTFIMFNGEFTNWYINQFIARNGIIELLFSSNNAGTIREAIREGLAITIENQFDLINNPHIQSGEVVPIPLHNTITNESFLGFVNLKGKKYSPIAKSFMKLFKYHLQETFKDEQSEHKK